MTDHNHNRAVRPGGVEKFEADITAAEIIRRLGPGRGPARADLVRDCVEKAAPAIGLTAVYVEADVRPAAGGVEVGGVLFSSPGLRLCLSGAALAFPYIVTAGPAVDEAAAAAGDAFEQYVIEFAAGLAVERAVGRLGRLLGARAGSAAVSAVSPGCLAGWPSDDLPRLFALFGGEEAAVGVRLSGGSFMVPRKSVCGLFYPSAEAFSSCRICDRRGCPSRTAACDAAAAQAFRTKIS